MYTQMKTKTKCTNNYHKTRHRTHRTVHQEPPENGSMSGAPAALTVNAPCMTRYVQI